MKKLFNNAIASLLIIVIVLSAYVPVFAVGEPSSYSDTYNSGERDVVCTTLNGTGADAYYNGSYEYDVLSTLSSAQLLSSLRTLMTNTHTRNSSYEDCKTMASKTDCENENGKVLLLYTSVTSTQSQANSGWNREHVWPKSLGGYETSGPGADLHHIRPSDNRVNSCRNNNKYGEVNGGSNATGGNAASGISGGFYAGGYFEPLDNVKGDVARICLYMYVRYGASYSKCSNITNVFQSIDVLLAWCEMDPVDTWEMGRNEVVEAFQGNRNVFIDYPEYAWLLFGREVPYDMVTPSGEAMSDNGCEHTSTSIRNQLDPTCGKAGYTGDTYCDDCGRKVSAGTSILATGNHTTSVKNQKDATCGASGYTGDTYCVVCSTITVRGSIISPTGLHSFSSWEFNYETGKKTRTCSGCSKVETVAISAEECTHPSTDIRNQKDATCGVAGYTGDDCCVSCNEILRRGEIIPATGEHNYSEMIVVVAPGFLEEGEGKHVCLDCRDEKKVSIPAVSTGLDSMTVDELLAYVDTDEEKILILLALSSGDRLFLESLVN